MGWLDNGGEALRSGDWLWELNNGPLGADVWPVLKGHCGVGTAREDRARNGAVSSAYLLK
eukprot:gene3165-4677_t